MTEVYSAAPSGKSMTSSRLPSAQPEVLTSSALSFEARTSYEAVEDLTKFRSSQFRIRQQPQDDDIWKRPPPDFRLQVYAPKPAKRNSRQAMKPWRYRDTTSDQTASQMKPKENKRDNPILPQLIFAKKEVDEKPFITRFHVMDSFEARQEFAKTGQHPRKMYQMPQHHDFRAYPPISSFGLPEFETSHNKDPYNIKFHSERLDIMHDPEGNPLPTQRDTSGRQMAPVLRQPAKWESRLHLPKEEPWPNRYHAYTRYRLPWRSPDDVLMDRVEDVVTSQWSHEVANKMTSSKDTSQKKSFKESHRTMTLPVVDS